MALAERAPDDELITGINVTPLVDITLVLLIIVMVTATWVVSKTIPLDVPPSATSESTPTTLAVSVDREGRTYLDARPVDDVELRARIAAAHRSDPQARAIVAADGSTSHRAVVRVIDLLRQEGVTRLAIHVRPEEASRSGASP